MSDMYALKESTLTAFGDAIRSKQGVTEERFENIVLNGSGYEKKFTFSTVAPRYRVVVEASVKNANSFRNFYIYENGGSGAELFKKEILKIEDFTITLETNYPNPKLYYALVKTDKDEIVLNMTIIPLDENGNEYKYTPMEMVEAINGFNVVPESVLTIIGACDYRFTQGHWDWFIEEYGNQIITNNISSIGSMFNYSKVEAIPFDINLSGSISSMNNVFQGCGNLKQVPLLKGDLKPPTSNYSANPNIDSMFYSCQRLKYIPYDYFDNFGGEEFWAAAQQYSASRGSMFNYCHSLRQLPNISKLVNKNSSSYSHLYYNLCSYCYVLDEINDLPVCNLVALTGNCFLNTFNFCYRLKELIFSTDNGTPKTAEWKNQTIDLTQSVGYSRDNNNITNHNSGITTDKNVNNNDAYQALKDDPDWYSTQIEYSRYNHDSAVNTINSLPDTSAYGTNTIKFQGAAGSATDGGAIDTLTEAEIAVAAAKGWTVTLS